jgi:hypothetical protein
VDCIETVFIICIYLFAVFVFNSAADEVDSRVIYNFVSLLQTTRPSHAVRQALIFFRAPQQMLQTHRSLKAYCATL